MKIEVLYHSSIRFTLENKIIYFDPFEIKDETHDANIIFITHSHFDHYSKKDIDKIINTNTIIVEPKSMKNRDYKNVIYVNPSQSIFVDGIEVSIVPSYNNSKNFHKKSDGFVGYILKIDDETYYVMGDTDENKDILNVKADNIFIPIGGKYTFDYLEAKSYINKVKPKRVYPTHLTYCIEDHTKVLNNFKKLIDKNIEVIF